MDKTSFSVEFLPLNFLIEILTDMESSDPGTSLSSQAFLVFPLTHQSVPIHFCVALSCQNIPYLQVGSYCNWF